MESLKDSIPDRPIHRRQINIATYPLGEERLVIEGWLKDDRLVSGYHWDGTPRPAGIVHWMGIRLLVEGSPPVIMQAEAEMPQVPHEACPEILDAVKRLMGLSISSGFTAAVLERLGGVKGCTHMTQLILAMGPAALHGYWTQQARQRRPRPASLEEVSALDALRDSCHLWGENGPLMQLVREMIEGRKDQT